MRDSQRIQPHLAASVICRLLLPLFRATPNWRFFPAGGTLGCPYSPPQPLDGSRRAIIFCGTPRHMNPSSGRFVSTARPGEHIRGEHAYAYAENSPTNLLDPSGLLLGSGYGNYCGYSRVAASDGVDRPSAGNQPKDCLGKACMIHDCCLLGLCQVLNPIPFYQCNATLCDAAWEAWDGCCANSPTPKLCRRAAWDVMLLSCLTHPPIWQRP
jgi:hypothetical protein